MKLTKELVENLSPNTDTYESGRALADELVNLQKTDDNLVLIGEYT